MRIKELESKLIELLEFPEKLAGTVVMRNTGLEVRQFPQGRGLGTFAGLYAIDSILRIFCAKTGKNLEEEVVSQDFPILIRVAKEFFSQAGEATMIPEVKEKIKKEEEMFIQAINHLK